VEILIEVVGELVLGVVSVAIGFAVGSVIFLLVRAGRRSLRRLEPPAPVVDPEGRMWTVRVGLAPVPLRYQFSKQFFRMRPVDQARRTKAGEAIDSVKRGEVAHPSTLVERFDELSGFVAWVILAATLLAVAVLLLELLVVLLIAVPVFAFRIVWGRWQCEIIDPDGGHFHVPAGSLSEARSRCSDLREQIRRGIYMTQGN
jgi:hypothetical protein